jgi:carbohydrate-binding DOMON domain-containing protein
MRGDTVNRMLAVAVWLLLIVWSAAALAEGPTILKDPAGDDKGPGAYRYPTGAEYKAGSFDMVGFEIEDKGKKVEFRIAMKLRFEDPWDSKAWTPPGNGFSLQFFQIYVDKDHKDGSGHKEGLPGLNIRFKEESRWEKVVLVSPQPSSRIKMEVKMKAKGLAADIIVPTTVSIKGKTVSVSIAKEDLGELAPGWGYQVVVQSNEGYPDGSDLLTRDVNEVAGEHRFGGGSDWDCDPHVIDMLAGAAAGKDDEKQAQYDALKFECAGADTSKAKLAELPMVYPK